MICVAAPSGAAVTYSFSGEHGSFSFTTDQFVAGASEVSALDLNSCQTSLPMLHCISMQFFSDSSDFAPYSPPMDVVAFGEAGPAVGNHSFYYFADGALRSSGVYSTVGFFKGTLIVTGVPGAVPEPTPWVVMIGGFGFVGGAMRVRRRTAGFV